MNQGSAKIRLPHQSDKFTHSCGFLGPSRFAMQGVLQVDHGIGKVLKMGQYPHGFCLYYRADVLMEQSYQTPPPTLPPIDLGTYRNDQGSGCVVGCCAPGF